jgi:hypothetical protein
MGYPGATFLLSRHVNVPVTVGRDEVYHAQQGNSAEVRMTSIEQVAGVSGNDGRWHLKHCATPLSVPDIANSLTLGIAGDLLPV